jgi:DNA-binding transcriptional regulator LsrR (DeoR family)
MPRVNIYLPNDIYELTSRWRSAANLSEICARAIRDEFEAADAHRAPLKLLDAVAPPSDMERALTRKYGLAESIIVEPPENPMHAREQLGLAAADYLDRTVSDGSMIGIAGGRQTWCLVRALRPRRERRP